MRRDVMTAGWVVDALGIDETEINKLIDSWWLRWVRKKIFFNYKNGSADLK